MTTPHQDVNPRDAADALTDLDDVPDDAPGLRALAQRPRRFRPADGAGAPFPSSWSSSTTPEQLGIDTCRHRPVDGGPSRGEITGSGSRPGH